MKACKETRISRHMNHRVALVCVLVVFLFALLGVSACGNDVAQQQPTELVSAEATEDNNGFVLYRADDDMASFTDAAKSWQHLEKGRISDLYDEYEFVWQGTGSEWTYEKAVSVIGFESNQVFEFSHQYRWYEADGNYITVMFQDYDGDGIRTAFIKRPACGECSKRA